MYSPPTWARKPKLSFKTAIDNTDDSEQHEKSSLSNLWTIDEIKNGVILQTYPLDEVSLITFGRVPYTLPSSSTLAIQSIITAHESCSRLHARIAFDSNSIPWLKDLQSANGTTVNKKNLPPQSISKLEESSTNTNGFSKIDKYKEGSRGVIIYPGDILQFGASTRIYVFNGPEELERGSLFWKRVLSSHISNNTSMVNCKINNNDSCHPNKYTSMLDNNHKEDGISWGIGIDNDYQNHNIHNHKNDVFDNYSPLSLLQQLQNTKEESLLQSKYNKLYTKLQTQSYKLQNIQQESKHIEQKSLSTSLTQGQIAQLERNSKKEEELKISIQNLESDLLDRLKDELGKESNSQKKSLMKKRKRKNEDEEDDVDDFYDRTTQKSNSNSSSNTNALLLQLQDDQEEQDVETEESLILKWKSLLTVLSQQKNKVELAQNQVDFIIEKQTKVQNHDEDLQNNNNEDKSTTLFFIQNELDVARENYDSQTTILEKLVGEIDSTERLLKIVNNKLTFDRDSIEIRVMNDKYNMQHSNSYLNRDGARTNSVHESFDKNNNMDMPPPLSLLQRHENSSPLKYEILMEGNSRTTSINHSQNRNDSIDMPAPSLLLQSQKQQSSLEYENVKDNEWTTINKMDKNDIDMPPPSLPLSSIPSRNDDSSIIIQSSLKRNEYGYKMNAASQQQKQQHKINNCDSFTVTDNQATHSSCPSISYNNTLSKDEISAPSNEMQPKQLRKVRGPMRPTQTQHGTLSALLSSTVSDSFSTQKQNAANSTINSHDVKSKNNTTIRDINGGRSDDRAASIGTETDSRKDEWIAPENQDGSGWTTLNEKFLGRY